MLALLTERGGGKWTGWCLGPLVEEIGVFAEREIGIRILPEALAQV